MEIDRRSVPFLKIKFHLAAAGLLLIHALLSFFAARNKSLTYDEVAHLPAGISYLLTRDTRLNPEHPPLMKLWAALPTLGFVRKFDTENPHWINAGEWRKIAQAEGVNERSAGRLERSINEQFGFGSSLLFQDNKETCEQIVTRSRWVMILISVITGLLVYLWGSRAIEHSGALISLGFYAFTPDLLAHAPLANTDIGFMMFSTATLFALYEYLMSSREFPRDVTILFALSIALAGTFLSRFSAPVTLGFLFVALLLCVIRKPEIAIHSIVRSKALGLGAALITSYILVVFFEFVLFGELSYLTGLQLISQSVLIPVNATYFTLGRWSSFRMDYFILCLGLKLSIPFLIALVICIAAIVRSKRPREAFIIYLSAFIVWFFIFATFYFPNRGIRYLFPIYPALLLAVGWLFAKSGAGLRKLMVGLLALHALSSVAAYPNYLAYMNEGARMMGKERLLGDSNLDWGQDLLALGEYMKQEKMNSIKGLLFTTVDPSYYGIQIEAPKLGELESSPSGTRMAFSIHALQGQKPETRARIEQWRLIDRLNDTIYIYEKP